MRVKNGSKDLKRYPQISRRVRDTLTRLSTALSPAALSVLALPRTPSPSSSPSSTLMHSNGTTNWRLYEKEAASSRVPDRNRSITVYPSVSSGVSTGVSIGALLSRGWGCVQRAGLGLLPDRRDVRPRQVRAMQ